MRLVLRAIRSLLQKLEKRLDDCFGLAAQTEGIVKNKMDKYNPAGEGSISLNRMAESTTGYRSACFGNDCVASGDYSFADGYECKAVGNYSFAMGKESESVGLYAFSVGYGAKANTPASFAEGWHTVASGNAAHAEGWKTAAKKSDSHAEGYCTIAASDHQHAQGLYNIEDNENKYLHIVGNGTGESSRSNAHTLDWDGNAWFAGTVEGTALILTSSTEGSSKRFKITVDDSGTLTATELT